MALVWLCGVVADRPGPPGNRGHSHGINVTGLRRLNVPIATACRFSLILWAAITLPLLLAGFVAVVLTGVRMGELHRHASGQSARKPDVGVDESSISSS